MLDNNFNSQGIMNAILTTLLHTETMALISQSLHNRDITTSNLQLYVNVASTLDQVHLTIYHECCNGNVNPVLKPN